MSAFPQIDNEALPPPPSLPPPLLSEAQILSLAQQGHLQLPLPPHLRALYTQLNRSAANFFALPAAAKSTIYPPINTELGYVDIPNEKSYISFRAQTTHSTTELESLAAEVWRETYTLLYRILCDLAWAMDTTPAVWDKIVDGVSPMPTSLEDATATFLRVFRYEPTTGIAESHADLGLLTLCVGEGQGLQVRAKDPESGEVSWIEYSEPTLLVGKTLRALSGGRVRAGVHRVLGNENGRNSTVFALRPCVKHEIDMTQFPGGQGVVHMGELWRQTWMGAFNVNASRQVREKQKERQREMKRTGELNYGVYDMTNTLAAIAD
jgi:isopenicillin N synthase-like dioxygenase